MRRRVAIVAALVLAPCLVIAVPAALVYRHVHIVMPPRLSEAARAAAMAPLRAVVDGGAPARPSHPELERQLPAPGTVIVSLWSYGHRAARVEGHGATAADALADAGTRLAAAPALAAISPEARQRARLQVDVVAGRAPMVTEWRITRELGLVAGLDGFGVTLGSGREVLLGPDELVEKRLLDATTPIPTAPDFRVGLGFDRADAELAVRAALPAGHYGLETHRYFRFRPDSFVEPVDPKAGAPLQLTRGLPPGPALTKDHLHDAVVRGASYLQAHLAENGRYVYQLDLATGGATDPNDPRGDYSLPRHAGATYFLAQAYGFTHDPAIRATVERALDHMVFLIKQGGCTGQTPDGKPWMCVAEPSGGKAYMGSTALAVVAIAQYRLETGDGRYDEAQLAMVEWMLMQQKGNGRFSHIFDVPTKQSDWKTELLYFDGEAALALIRSYKIFHDPRMLRATERALDALVGWYDFFAGQFFFGEEHWTCITAEAAWPDLKKDRYNEFCTDYAAFLRDGQFGEGEIPTQEDLAGSYSITPFFVPHNTPVGSRSEAMISAYLLSVHHGKPDPKIRAQVLIAMRYLLRQQVKPENDFNTAVPYADGALTESAIDRTVRIDFIQHSCSAMLRAIPLLDEPQQAK